MTPLELLAAKVRGADNNVEGATIIANWYLDQTRHAANLARESAAIVQKDGEGDSILAPLAKQVSSNFNSIADMLTRNNDNGNA